MNIFPRLREALSKVDLVLRRRDRRQADAAVQIGNRAAADGDIALAIAAFRMASSIDPVRSGPAFKLANSLKDVGAVEDAIALYSDLAERSDADAGVSINLGHALRQAGRPADAVESFVRALKINPRADEARYMLLIMGAGARIHEPGPSREAVVADLSRLESSIQSLTVALQQFSGRNTYPTGAWNAFRRDFPIPSAPSAPARKYGIVVDAAVPQPALLRRTLLSLISQSTGNWQAVVVGAPFGTHSVTSFSRVDDRIRFVDEHIGSLDFGFDGDVDAIVSIAPGAVLDDEALTWIGWALDYTSADIVYSDHDHLIEQWSTDRIYGDPVLFGVFDPVWPNEKEKLPIVLGVAPSMLPVLEAAFINSLRSIRSKPEGIHREVLRSRIGTKPVPHIPITLSSQLRLPDAAARLEEAAVALPSTKVVAPKVGDLELITAIVPTKDQGLMLAECVDSLYGLCRHPERLKVVIVDNNSEERATAQVISQLVKRYGVELHSDCAGFNWSLLNNSAAAQISEGIIVLCNNDTVMLTDGWDDQLRFNFSDLNVGVVGARLLYPERQLQHAGIVLGFGNGAPKHEGVGALEFDSGPEGRWRQRRAVSAVTGAFLAVPAPLFHQIGGLDALALPIAYNDVDFCLKVREAGRVVLYDPVIELIHKESKTRGLNTTASKVAWDEGELFDLKERWGRACVDDPYINPTWSRSTDSPLSAYAKFSRSELESYVARSNSINPWAPRRR